MFKITYAPLAVYVTIYTTHPITTFIIFYLNFYLAILLYHLEPNPVLKQPKYFRRFRQPLEILVKRDIALLVSKNFFSRNHKFLLWKRAMNTSYTNCKAAH